MARINSFRHGNSQRGDSTWLFLIFIALVLIVLSLGEQTRIQKALLTGEVEPAAPDRREHLDRRFFAMAKDALNDPQAKVPLGAWVFRHADAQQSQERLLVLEDDGTFQLHSRSLAGWQGRVLDSFVSSGTYTVTGSVLDLSVTEGRPTYAGPYIIDPAAGPDELRLRWTPRDISLFREADADTLAGFLPPPTVLDSTTEAETDDQGKGN